MTKNQDMSQTFVNVASILLFLIAAVSIRGDGEEEQQEEYVYATSWDAHMVYEDTHYFEIVSPASLSYTYKLRQAKDFGVDFDREYKKVRLVVAEPVEACRAITNDVSNTVALVIRGGCSFLTKSRYSEAAGAFAVIIADNDEDNDEHMVDMVDDETGRKIGIPSLFMMGKDGLMIRRKLMVEGLDEAIINIPINLTGTVLGSAKLPPWTLW